MLSFRQDVFSQLICLSLCVLSSETTVIVLLHSPAASCLVTEGATNLPDAAVFSFAKKDKRTVGNLW